jgi:hypothetical protein
MAWDDAHPGQPEELRASAQRRATGALARRGDSHRLRPGGGLTEHAADTAAAREAGIAEELISASEDTRELRDLLHANVDASLKVSGMATLRSICSMWESEQARIEELSASVDTDWHRRWRARSVVERLLRRGVRQPEATALPYR